MLLISQGQVVRLVVLQDILVPVHQLMRVGNPQLIVRNMWHRLVHFVILLLLLVLGMECLWMMQQRVILMVAIHGVWTIMLPTMSMTNIYPWRYPFKVLIYEQRF